MKGQIVSYRRSRHGQTPDQAIVRVDDVSDREKAQALVGKEVSWKSVHAVIPGVVASPHGNKGALRVRFTRGLPGQAISQFIEFA